MARSDVVIPRPPRGIPFRFTGGRRTFYVDLIGLTEARGKLEMFREACRAVGVMRSTVGTDKIYGFGQEYGYHPRGRLARKAGGAFYMRAGYDAVRVGNYDAKFARAILKGRGSVEATKREMEQVVINRARTVAPIRRGGLRGSIRRR